MGSSEWRMHDPTDCCTSTKPKVRSMAALFEPKVKSLDWTRNHMVTCTAVLLYCYRIKSYCCPTPHTSLTCRPTVCASHHPHRACAAATRVAMRGAGRSRTWDRGEKSSWVGKRCANSLAVWMLADKGAAR